jgi:hypothetical protein
MVTVAGWLSRLATWIPATHGSEPSPETTAGVMAVTINTIATANFNNILLFIVYLL